MAGYARRDGVLSQRIDGMKTFLPSGTVTPSAYAGLMVNRAEFDQALAAQAVAAGAEIMTDAALVSLDTDRRIARIRQTGRNLDVAYRILVAADGPHSTTARLMGLPALPVIHTRQYTVLLAQPYADTDIWLSDEFPGGYAWLFPKDTLANLGLGADRRFESDLKAPLARLHAELARQGRVGADILQRTGGAIPVGGLRANLACGNVLFVGDAAGLTHPITGAGIAAAVQSGECAASAVVDYIGGNARALSTYDEDMREQYGPVLARAVERREQLAHCWHSAAARDDRVQRRGWIAFEEYFA